MGDILFCDDSATYMVPVHLSAGTRGALPLNALWLVCAGDEFKLTVWLSSLFLKREVRDSLPRHF